MFCSNTKLKKTSDSIFQEADAHKDRSRPLEWRRSFNGLSLPLKNIEIITRVNTHDKDWDIKGDFKDNPVKLIKPDIKTSFAIKALVDEDQMRDTIYCAEQDGDDNDIYTLERPRGETQIILKSGEPIKENEKFADGIFYGSCFRMNYVPDEDDIIFEMTIPEEQLNTIASKLQSAPSSTIDLYVELLSFSFEVDDSLREHYHPRDIFIHDHSDAFVSSIGLASKVGTHSAEKSEDDEEEEYQYDDIDDPKELSPEQQSHRELVQVLLHMQKPLSNIVVAIWVLVFILGASIFV
ncbi:MAG: hypothetical protein ACRCYN_03215 [Plesiomonas sp.]